VDRLWVLNASFFFKQNFLSLKSLAFPLSSHTDSLLSRFTQYSLVSKGGISNILNERTSLALGRRCICKETSLGKLPLTQRFLLERTKRTVRTCFQHLD